MLLKRYLSRQVHYLVHRKLINPHFLSKTEVKDDNKHASPFARRRDETYD